MPLDSEIAVNTSGTPLVELEKLHDNKLVTKSLVARPALTKAIEKGNNTLEMVIYVWSLLARANEKCCREEEAYDRSKGEFESLEIGVSEHITEYFVRVHVVLMKLTMHQVTTLAKQNIDY